LTVLLSGTTWNQMRGQALRFGFVPQQCAPRPERIAVDGRRQAEAPAVAVRIGYGCSSAALLDRLEVVLKGPLSEANSDIATG
jgi:hypothetical protein